jgi:hypothetical protein
VYEACPGRVLTADEVKRTLGGTEFDAVRNETDYLLSELERVYEVGQRTKLPEQQIHADAHMDNFLAVDDVVTAGGSVWF